MHLHLQCARHLCLPSVSHWRDQVRYFEGTATWLRLCFGFRLEGGSAVCPGGEGEEGDNGGRNGGVGLEVE